MVRGVDGLRVWAGHIWSEAAAVPTLSPGAHSPQGVMIDAAIAASRARYAYKRAALHFSALSTRGMDCPCTGSLG